MNREDCEKLLDACINAWLLLGQANQEKLDEQFARETAENLRDVIVGIMADEKKPAYRDGGIAAPGTICGHGSYTTLTRPAITCDGRGEITAMTATWDGSDDRDGIAYDLGRLDERKK